MRFCLHKLIENAQYSCAYAQQHCDFYRRINFVKIFHCDIQNPFLFGLFVTLLILFVYSIITFISSKFFTKSIESIKEKLQLNQVLASITILALANCMPDILMTSSSDKNIEGNYFVLSTLLGDFMFNSTITLGFVIFRGMYGIQLDKSNILKEVMAYFAVLVTVTSYSFLYKSLDVTFFYIFCFIYFTYLAATFFISKKINLDHEYIDVMEQSLLQSQLSLSQVKKHRPKSFENKSSYSNKDFEASEKPNFSTIIKTALVFPIKFLSVITVTSQNNHYFHHDCSRKVIILASTLFIFATLQNSLELQFNLILGVIIFLFIFDYLCSIFNQRLAALLFEGLSILACVCWMLNAIYIILDLFLFLSVYLHINSIILAVLLISIGNQLIGKINRLFQ